VGFVSGFTCALQTLLNIAPNVSLFETRALVFRELREFMYAISLFQMSSTGGGITHGVEFPALVLRCQYFFLEFPDFEVRDVSFLADGFQNVLELVTAYSKAYSIFTSSLLSAERNS
jgi:hypothetical protein